MISLELFGFIIMIVVVFFLTLMCLHHFWLDQQNTDKTENDEDSYFKIYEAKNGFTKVLGFALMIFFFLISFLLMFCFEKFKFYKEDYRFTLLTLFFSFIAVLISDKGTGRINGKKVSIKKFGPTVASWAGIGLSLALIMISALEEKHLVNSCSPESNSNTINEVYNN